MQRSESIADLVAALAGAQGEFAPVTKDNTAKIASTKGSFSFHYADLPTAIGATRPALTSHGLAVVQPVRTERDHVVVTTILAHSSGQWISEECAWPVADDDNRSIGSGITYARRHAYLAIIGAAASDEDDDGEAARGGNHETRKPSPGQRIADATAQANANARAQAVKEKIGGHLDRLGYERTKHSDQRKSLVMRTASDLGLDPELVDVEDLEKVEQALGRVVNTGGAESAPKPSPDDRAQASAAPSPLSEMEQKAATVSVCKVLRGAKTWDEFLRASDQTKPTIATLSEFRRSVVDAVEQIIAAHFTQKDPPAFSKEVRTAIAAIEAKVGALVPGKQQEAQGVAG